jgi:hypothetical protein
VELCRSAAAVLIDAAGRHLVRIGRHEETATKGNEPAEISASRVMGAAKLFTLEQELCANERSALDFSPLF